MRWMEQVELTQDRQSLNLPHESRSQWFIFCVLHPHSKAEEAHDQRRLPDVPPARRRLDSQPSSQKRVSGHEPAAPPLLYLVLPQHIPNGRPTQRAQQHRGLYQVRIFYICLRDAFFSLLFLKGTK